MRYVTPVLLAALILAFALTASAAAPQPYIPQTPIPPNARLVATDYLTVTPILDRVNGYTSVSLAASHGVVVKVYEPGGPVLPAITLTYRLPPGTKPIVRVEPLASTTLDAGFVEPAPLVHAYTPRGLVAIKAPDPRVYNETTTPGVLYRYDYRATPTGTIVRVTLYPVQHRAGKLLVYTQLRISVYAALGSHEYPAPREAPHYVLLVIAPTYDLARFVASLAQQAHPEATVLAAGLENVTQALPLPLQAPIPGVLAPTVPPIPYLDFYNYTLAAQIRGFIAEMVKKYHVTHVLLVGGAREIPPSYYYSSRLEWFYAGIYNAWIPTDYFYADLDLDDKPDVYVGRLPFSDRDLLTTYFEKVMLYESMMKKPTLALIAGYPFASMPPFGEAALSTMTYTYHALRGLITNTIMTRTLGNYTRENFRNLILDERQPAWIYVIAHGNGDVWADRVYNVTLDMITWEDLLNSTEIMNMSKPGRPVGVISSVACMNGAWDFDLVDPGYYYRPPSIGYAVVASWGGVAYVGHARVAFEWLAGTKSLFNASDGVVTISMGGVMLLHTFILREWSQGAKTLGEAVWEGAADYMHYWKSQVILDNYAPVPVTIGEAMVFELTLLGDPMLQLPAPQPETPEPIINLTGYYSKASFGLFFAPYASIFLGEVPVYRPCYAEKMGIEASAVKAVGIAWTKALPTTDLLALLHVETVRPPASIALGGNLTGYLLLGAAGQSGYLLVFAPALGLCGAYNGTYLTVKLWAADVITGGELIPVIVYSDGDTLNVVLDRNAEFSVRYEKPGEHRILALPRESSFADYYASRGLYELIKNYYTDHITVRVLQSLSINVGGYTAATGKTEIPVTITLNGRPVDAKLSVKLLAGKAQVSVTRVAPGNYIVELAGLQPGVYTLLLTAEYKGAYVDANGTRLVTVKVDELVSKAAERIEVSIKSASAEITREVKGEIGYLANKLRDQLAAIESGISNTRAAILSAIDDAENSIIGALDEKMGELKASLVKSVAESLAEAEQRIISKMSARIEDLSESLTGQVKTLLQQSSQELKQDIDAKLGEVNSKLGKLEERVSAVATTAQVSVALLAATLGASVGLYFRRLS